MIAKYNAILFIYQEDTQSSVSLNIVGSSDRWEFACSQYQAFPPSHTLLEKLSCLFLRVILLVRLLLSPECFSHPGCF